MNYGYSFNVRMSAVLKTGKIWKSQGISWLGKSYLKVWELLKDFSVLSPICGP